MQLGERRKSETHTIRSRFVVGADGANSTVASLGLHQRARMSLVEARDEVLRFVPGEAPMYHVAAYHEIIATPGGRTSGGCEVYYNSKLSPDFYAWVFPTATKPASVSAARSGASICATRSRSCVSRSA